jgi:6-phosphogluconolactonase
MKGHLEIFDSTTALQRGAADKIVSCLGEEILFRGMASFVLCGGSTPRGVYELLGSSQYSGRLDWKKVHFFWGDERCVGPTSPESNFRTVSELLIRYIGLPRQNVHRVRGEIRPPEAAREIEMDIRRFFGLKEGEFPRFSLVLLGLGDDGHTASLFPGSPALGERERIVSDVHVKATPPFRITLTVPSINNAATVMFLVSGRSKAAILKEVLKEGESRYPAQHVNPASGRLYWFADRDAASQIPQAEKL